MPTSLPRPFKSLTTVLLAASLLVANSPAVLAQEQPTVGAAAPVMDKQYVLRFGDTLNLRVVENEKLEIKDQPIRPDGRISLPLIGEVDAGGLTLPQLTQRVTKAYSKYYVEPHIIVNVAKFRPLAISVIGLVNKPDTFKVDEPVHLLQAIGLAGGIDRMRGDVHRILIARTNGTHKFVDLQDVMEGKIEDNVLLYDGDTVRVFEIGGPDWYLILPTVANSLSILTSIVVILLNLPRK